ncbi:hypothetical protein CH254_26065 [Rhodococcus sp. 06-412-2C]|uniref:hypothetical protein n=1 Tax=unclassified Rhodococcus (in: high G+C Gram-positive bacteria) TaxID=192944 RepID=UPI000B9C322A|nr:MULTISPECIES: hypothetical protein [unclassified Rhodococcus (in: high G+C Gram-positive bacteria)]OZC81837.1 hypothetical protein CH254_26065 [Rhodococcus sp. 06-412-2C]OZC95937.1 hypothetical protein CH279_16015 [Rhodococcus sp. 06-412-2B]
MKLIRTATVAVALTAAVATGAGHAVADPSSDTVNYQTSVNPDGSVKTILDAGLFRVDATSGTVSIIDQSGATLASVPLEYTVNGTVYSIAPLIGAEGRELTLTPQTVPVADAVGPRTKQQAFDNMVNQLAIGWNNGGGVGTAIGAGLGFAIGCVSIFPNFISGCIIGTVIGTVAGAVIGTANGNPQAQPAVFEYFTTP